MEKHVAAPPIITISRSSVKTTLEPTIKGRGVSDVGIVTRVTAWISDPEVEKTVMSSSRLIVPSQPTPPRTIKEPRSWMLMAPNLDRSLGVSFPCTIASLKLMVGTLISQHKRAADAESF